MVFNNIEINKAQELVSKYYSKNNLVKELLKERTKEAKKEYKMKNSKLPFPNFEL